MNKYEITFIVKTTIEEQEIKNIAENMKKVLTDNNAKIIEEKALGQKELAYEINKSKTGYYFLYIVESSSEAIDEFTRVARINENILRYLTIKVEN